MNNICNTWEVNFSYSIRLYRSVYLYHNKCICTMINDGLDFLVPASMIYDSDQNIEVIGLCHYFQSCYNVGTSR